ALRDRRRLPAFAIVPGFLAMADRWAEQDSVLGRDGEERDLAVEGDELLDDHARPVAAHIVDRIVPRLAELLGGLGGALALARARHDWLDDARQPDFLDRRNRFVAALRKAVLGSDEAQVLGG